MKKIILFSFIALGACLSSCKSPSSAYSTRTARSQEMPVDLWSTWTTADLNISDQKVRFTLEIPQNTNALISESQYKENAIGELLEKNSADVLINPLYKCEYKNGRLVSITVSGYPATYRNFRSVSFDDQVKYMIDKEKADNAPQVVINGGENKNEINTQK